MARALSPAMAAACCLMAALPFTPAALVAQTSAPIPQLVTAAPDAAPAEPRLVPRLYGSADWQFSRPLRHAGGAALFVAVGRQRCEDGICVAPGVQATAHVGRGGWRIGAGPAWGPLFGADVLVTMTRTWSAPRGASDDSTYVGVEGGYQLLFLRSAVGVARRVEGASGPRRTIVTWNVGVRIPVVGF